MLRGSARFTADLPDPTGCLHAAFVRSNDAHGVLLDVDVGQARAARDVVAVLTAADLGLAPHSLYPATTLDGAMARPPLASERVRFVGEPVAVVLADSRAAALDAVELVVVDVEPLPVHVDPREAAASGELLFPDAGTNAIVDLPASDTPDPTEGAAFVAEVRSDSPRLTSLPIEPCAIVVDPTGGQLDVVCTGQGVHRQRDTYAEIFQLSHDELRVRHPHVGGGFGGRGDALPEFIVVVAAALQLNRPVRWTQSRAEQFVSMPHGRGQVHDFRVGFDSTGAIVGIDAAVWCDAGAYPHMAAVLAGASRRQSPSVYRVPALRYRIGAAVTNTPPVGAYRGAGQPEVNLALERAMDIGAGLLGLDPIELRRRNLLTATDLPYTTQTGLTLETGDPLASLDAALVALEVESWRDEQARRRSAGAASAIGIGVGCYSQTAGSGTDGDFADLELLADGTVHVSCASAQHGQGHHSLWAQLVAERMGVAPDAVVVVDADSDRTPTGQTTGGSRTSFVLGSQIAAGADLLYDQARLAAANRLEAHPDDLVASEQGWSVAGVPARLVGWGELAEPGEPIRATLDTRIGGPTHPYGTHASVVEVDLETGGVRLLRHVAVDDCGTVLDRSSVEGQQHGGAVSGISPALWEAARWDPDGTPRTNTLIDYLIPSAAELPMIETLRPAMPSNRNPLGVRGIGENGAIAAPAAVQNAVLDALAPHGVDHLDIPLSPEVVWRAIA